jgi:hypothetical protein
MPASLGYWGSALLPSAPWQTAQTARTVSRGSAACPVDGKARSKKANDSIDFSASLVSRKRQGASFSIVIFSFEHDDNLGNLMRVNLF